MALDTSVLSRPSAAIKILLILLSIIAFGSVTDYTTKCPRRDGGFHLKYTDVDHSEFFVAIYVLLFLGEGTILFLYLTAMDWLMTLRGINWWLVELIGSSFWAFMMLLASCLLSDGIQHVEDWYIKNYDSGKDCNYTGWKFGVAVGFIAFFAMLGQCWYLYKELRDSGFTSDGSYEPLDDDNEAGEVTVSV